MGHSGPFLELAGNRGSKPVLWIAVEITACPEFLLFLINSNKNVLKEKKIEREKKFIKYVLIPHPGKGGAVAPPACHQDLLGFLCTLLCSELETRGPAGAIANVSFEEKANEGI